MARVIEARRIFLFACKPIGHRSGRAAVESIQHGCLKFVGLFIGMIKLPQLASCFCEYVGGMLVIARSRDFREN